MCLYTKNVLQKAEKDIECYKVLKHYIGLEYSINIFCTPWTNTFVNINATFRAVGRDTLSTNDDKTFIYSEGFIHIFKSIKDAIYYMEILDKSKNNSNIKYEIYKCIIPKDTLYVEGKTASNRDSYASKKIKFIEEIVI